MESLTDGVDIWLVEAIIGWAGGTKIRWKEMDTAWMMMALLGRKVGMRKITLPVTSRKIIKLSYILNRKTFSKAKCSKINKSTALKKQCQMIIFFIIIRKTTISINNLTRKIIEVI